MAKKLIGFLLWIVAFAIPFRYALLNTSDVSNTIWLLSFVVMIVLIFTGYILVDSANSKQAHDEHGH